MSYLGDFATGVTLDTKFCTVQSTGAPTTLSGTPAISVYKDNSTTQSTSGVTLSADFDGVTGLNNVRIDTSSDGSFYSTGSNFQVVITTGTVNSVSVVGYVVAEFSLNNRSALRPTTAARTLDVSSGGEAGIDWSNVGSPTTSVTLSGTTVGTATALGTGAVTATAVATGAIDADALAADAATKIADALLNRDMSAVSDTNSRSPLNALRFLRNKWSISGTTLTVTEEDDSTTAWTSALTTNASADPITASDPA